MPNKEQRTQVKQMLVEQLRLRMDPADIGDDEPLFGDGLGLDSVDALELVAGVEQRFGVIIESEDEARTVFQSVSALADFLNTKGGFA